ncbi:hypothetical protein AB3N59_18665 [Leptospira sp. WS92.C1]
MEKDFVSELNKELKAKGLPEVKPGSQTQLRTCSGCGRAVTLLYSLGRCRICITTGYKSRVLPPGKIKFF